jgi:hypothetical protein
MTNMSELKIAATNLWSRLVQAMRQDGHISDDVVQSGPATTKVIVEACQASNDKAWLSMTIRPQPGRHVVACDKSGNLHVVHYDPSDACWKVGSAKMPEFMFKGWCFVDYRGSES